MAERKKALLELLGTVRTGEGPLVAILDNVPDDSLLLAAIYTDRDVLVEALWRRDEILRAGSVGVGAGMAAAASSIVAAGIKLPSALEMAKQIVPSTLAPLWAVVQYTQDPAFNCPRPHTCNRGTPAALMHEVFGEFLDLARTVEVDSQSFHYYMELAKAMSDSYVDLGSATAQGVQVALGCLPTGAPGGKEEARARRFRAVLQDFIAEIAPSSSPSCKIEPLQIGNRSNVKIDGSWVLPAASTSPNPMCHVLLIEAKEGNDVGVPMFQLLSYFTLIIQDALCRRLPTVLRTCFPTLAVELCGDCFRVDALYMIDKPSCQPLTPFLHLSDMRTSVPGYTEMAVRALKALALSATKLASSYQPLVDSASATAATVGVEAAVADSLQARDLHVHLGVPYMLQSYIKVTRLPGQQLVYLCEGDASDATIKLVAKLLPRTPAAYATALHTEAAAKGCVPKLLGTVDSVAGGFTLLRMEHLDPANGWTRLDGLDQFPADFSEVQQAASSALQRLHSCLGGTAVHGDLRPPNIFVRLVPDATGVEAMFVDLDWAGAQGTAMYPFDIAPHITWPLQDPAGQAITQEHDRQLLAASLSGVEVFCRGRAKRARHVAPGAPAASGAAGGHVG